MRVERAVSNRSEIENMTVEFSERKIRKRRIYVNELFQEQFNVK